MWVLPSKEDRNMYLVQYRSHHCYRKEYIQLYEEINCDESLTCSITTVIVDLH